MDAPYDIVVYDLRDPSKLDNLKDGIWMTPLGILTKNRLRTTRGGYLGLDLSGEQAQEIKRSLHDALKNRLTIRPSKYRQEMKITKERAFEIAKAYLKRKKNQDWCAEHTWADEVTFFSESDVTWSFSLVSPSLQARGAIPGSIIATVDKLDGHVWSEDEFAFYEVLNDG